MKVGDRVQLVSCSGSPGLIVGVNRGKILVIFDDSPAVRWALRPKSLQPEKEKN